MKRNPTINRLFTRVARDPKFRALIFKLSGLSGYGGKLCAKKLARSLYNKRIDKG